MKHIEEKVMAFINNNNMLEGTDRVYVATSGGADSMALLAFMNTHQDELEIKVGAVHVNHGIRGETARRDAEFVRNYCNANNIEYVLFDAERDNIIVPENASEEWARRLRYDYFAQLLASSPIGTKIATAHTLSDQTETILFRMARGGSGLNGLTGIPMARENYIRPFINITRAEVEELVEYYGTGNITDETNLGDDYSRNKIRHSVVPVLKGINPNAEESFGKVCDRIRKAQTLISDLADGKLLNAEIIPNRKYNIREFQGDYEIINEEMISKLLSKINITLNEKYIEVIEEFIKEAESHTGDKEEFIGSVNVSDNTSINITTKYITVRNKTDYNELDQHPLEEHHYHTPNCFGYELSIHEMSYEDFKKECQVKSSLCFYADADKLDISNCIVRVKQEGDRFTPACKVGGKVSKFMKNIPIIEKDYVPIIECNGKIIWVWGVGFTDGFTPTENSRKVIKIDYYKH